ncbi:MAG: 4Fe-4S dicluster domain-containing protein [Candidatus Methylomirabilales bacterium]
MTAMLVVDPARCTGCRMCELACSLAKTGAFAPALSRIRVHVFAEDFKHIPLACFQCSDAPCARACPAAALLQGDGLVRFVREKCIGCRMCMLACPFGVISFDDETRAIAKCDTCDGDPECVKFCAYGTLTFREGSLAAAPKGRDFARRVADAAKA